MGFRLVSSAFGWKAITSILPQFREQSTFEVTQEGVKFKLLDASRNSFMSMDWNKDKFKSYLLEGESKKVQFYTNDIEKIMKRFSNEDVVIVSTTATNTLLFEKEGTETSFDARLIVESDESGYMELPAKVPIETRFGIEVKVLEKMIADSEVFDCEEAWFHNVDGKLIFTGKSGSGESNGMLLENFDIEIKDTAFRFEYLKPFINSIKPFAEPVIQAGISEAKPLLLDVEIKNVGIVKFLLAPKLPTM